MMKNRPTKKHMLDQAAVNSILGSVVGLGLLGWLFVFPEKDMKADPITTTAVGFLGFSSGGGLVVSVAHLRRGSDEE